jgi:hypothetical protein
MPDTAVAALRTCPVDGEPVIFTFKFPGHEYVCIVCGWLGGVLGTPMSPATPERVERHDVLLAEFNAKHGIAPAPQDVPRPTCNGCGVVAEGSLDHSGKPAHWYSRTKDGVTSYACSKSCIPPREMVMPW